MVSTKTNKFLEKTRRIHNNKYDYSETVYKHSLLKIKIRCKTHGDFYMTPNNHLNGQGCRLCGNEQTKLKQKKDINTFVKQANTLHKNKYDYSKSEYVNNKSKIKIICPKHGEFCQTPDNHISAKNGCPLCVKNPKITVNDFITRSIQKHGLRYDYSHIKYENLNKKIKIKCINHGFFYQKPNHHISGSGCPKCSNKHNYSTKEFIETANEIHENKYDYSLTNYINAKTKIKIICHKHGEFCQAPSSHLNGRGCNVCSESKGEKGIRLFLKKNDIKYIPQHTFIDCLNIETHKKLPFDFFLPDQNICIEYNGKQHYQPINYFGGENNFKKQINRDYIKKQYCKKKHIGLIAIKYTENINQVLTVALLDQKCTL
jgi:hypothetical protein